MSQATPSPTQKIIAEINLAQLAPGLTLDCPEMASFHQLRLQIQAELESMPGYIWSIDQESGEYAQHPEDPRVLINMSTWRDRGALAKFMRLPAHQEAMRRAAEWFVPMEAPTLAIWEVDEGHQPTVTEGLERLKLTKAISSTDMARARNPEIFTE